MFLNLSKRAFFFLLFDAPNVFAADDPEDQEISFLQIPSSLVNLSK